MSAHPSIIPQELLAYINSAQDGCRCLRLPHPRTGALSLFLPYTRPVSNNVSASATSVILEVQSIAPDANRSWFLSEGEVVSDGKLLVLCQIDPAFVLAHLLGALPIGDGAGRFLPFEDLFEETAAALTNLHSASQEDGQDLGPPPSAADIMEFGKLDCVRHALNKICDIKEPAPGLEVYRFSRPRMLELLRRKVDNLSRPMTFDAFPSLMRALAKDGLGPGAEGANITPALRAEARTRAACEVISHYISPAWKTELVASYDFKLFDGHVKTLFDEASAALPPPAPNGGQQTKDAAGKKRKTASQGVEKLKKANVSGMAKMSTFFAKKA